MKRAKGFHPFEETLTKEEREYQTPEYRAFTAIQNGITATADFLLAGTMFSNEGASRHVRHLGQGIDMKNLDGIRRLAEQLPDRLAQVERAAQDLERALERLQDTFR